jgi:hypothetical protein
MEPVCLVQLIGNKDGVKTQKSREKDNGYKEKYRHSQNQDLKFKVKVYNKAISLQKNRTILCKGNTT